MTDTTNLSDGYDPDPTTDGGGGLPVTAASLPGAPSPDPSPVRDETPYGATAVTAGGGSGATGYAEDGYRVGTGTMAAGSVVEPVGVVAEPAGSVVEPVGVVAEPVGVVAEPVGGVPAGGLAVVGLLTLLLGAWAGIAVFVGPSFGWSPDGSAAWTWSLAHALLHAAPGAAAVVAGLVMVLRAPLAARGRGRSAAALTGVLAIIAGAWLVVGPFLWPVLRTVTAPLFVTGGSAVMSFTYVVGPNLGPGVLLAVTGSFALAWSLRSPVRSRPAPRHAAY